MTPPRTGQPAKLERALVRDAAGEVSLRAGVRLRPGQILVATNRGVRILDETTLTVRAAPFAVDGDVSLIGSDGAGRIWLVGDRVHLYDVAAGALDRLAPIPMLEASKPLAIGADPDARDGVIVSLGERGLLTLRVPEAATP